MRLSNRTDLPGAARSAGLRLGAQLISLIFHPLFITSYLTAFLLYIHPLAFAGWDPPQKFFRLITVFLSTAFLPLLAVLLSWRLGLAVKSLQLRTAKERIVPYVISLTLYWWPYHVFSNLPGIPLIATILLLGSFLAVCGGFFCNIFFRISMHAIAMGALMMFFLLYSFHDSYASGVYLSSAVGLAGLVCTARFLVSDHSPADVYGGLLVGALAQGIGWLVLAP
jgi:hypothetical protein